MITNWVLKKCVKLFNGVSVDYVLFTHLILNTLVLQSRELQASDIFLIPVSFDPGKKWILVHKLA